MFFVLLCCYYIYLYFLREEFFKSSLFGLLFFKFWCRLVFKIYVCCLNVLYLSFKQFNGVRVSCYFYCFDFYCYSCYCFDFVFFLCKRCVLGIIGLFDLEVILFYYMRLICFVKVIFGKSFLKCFQFRVFSFKGKWIGKFKIM